MLELQVSLGLLTLSANRKGEIVGTNGVYVSVLLLFDILFECCHEHAAIRILMYD